MNRIVPRFFWTALIPYKNSVPTPGRRLGCYAHRISTTSCCRIGWSRDKLSFSAASSLG
jgi:hypothetical protein